MNQNPKIAFDTNCLVRHIVQDDKDQCEAVAEVIGAESKVNRAILILDLVVLEGFWVLQTCYQFGREAWAEVLDELLHDSAFSFEDPDRLRSVLKTFRKGKADFGNYMISGLAKSHGRALQTFDRRLQSELP